MDENKRLKDDSVNMIINNHVLWSMGAGFIPIPLADMVAVSYIQMDMIKQLCKIYNIDYKDNELKATLTSITSAGLVKAGAGRLVKMIPVVGSALGGVAVSALSGASTYAVGHAFRLHFEQGGTFLDFDLNKLKKSYNDLFEKGKKVASEMKQEQEKVRKESEKVAEDKEMPKSGQDIINELKALAELKEAGLITEEEFAALKKKLIS
ncbi:MAG TPA: hypothetical protein DCX89_03270 [Saprospirales bacterium]|nr:hypothetical protein [Saprospirales bacterium]HRQ29605.1 DUF697 domain-containing protein [Saprospiraceae bacterium]